MYVRFAVFFDVLPRHGCRLLCLLGLLACCLVLALATMLYYRSSAPVERQVSVLSRGHAVEHFALLRLPVGWALCLGRSGWALNQPPAGRRLPSWRFRIFGHETPHESCRTRICLLQASAFQGIKSGVKSLPNDFFFVLILSDLPLIMPILPKDTDT